MGMIQADGLGKTYRVPVKQPGLRASLRQFLRPTYRHIAAVEGVSFRIEPGEVVGFLGPNGAGKTTTLKMLAGLLYPSRGVVRVGGFEPFQRSRKFLHSITLVMGNRSQLLWDLPALDSLRVNAAVYDLPARTARERIEELSGLLGLGDELSQPVRKLSLGQRMKAELLAALLHRPQVLFLDEPTLGLDVNAQTAVRSFIRSYNKAYGATVLLTSHYMADITALAQRVLVIHGGRLIHDGPLSDLVQKFAPYREIRLELSEVADRTGLQRFGEVEWQEGRSARLLVQADRLAETLSAILRAYGVLDLAVSEPPVEEVIARLFAGRSTGV